MVTCRRTVAQAHKMLIAAAREMIAAHRQLKASLRYSRIAQALLWRSPSCPDARAAGERRRVVRSAA